MSEPALPISNHQIHSSGGVANQVSGVGGSWSRVSHHATRPVNKLSLDPCEQLHPSFYTNPKAPLMFYGWAWTNDYLINYAIRHDLSYHLGDLEIHYIALAEPGFSKENFRYYKLLLYEVPEVVKTHLEARCGIQLNVEFPVERGEYDGVFALYSNRNALFHVEVLLKPGVAKFKKALGIIHTAMNEKGNKCDLLWWHCRDQYA
ncbi:hypothetical protein C8Q80DRAFT_1269042 [Daedaleopsis nitida]|nr:hypothetical protein C8Q80DRAFT_1269042 [Daedaleopsis nitida]